MKKLLLLAFLLLAVPRESFSTVAVCSTVCRDSYTGNGTTTAYTYTFRLLNKTHVKVYQNGVLKTVDTDYTVGSVGSATGTITFTVAPTSGHAIIFIRAIPIEQTSDYVQGQPPNMETIEGDYDKAAMVNQMQQEQLNRSLRYAETRTPTTALTELPAPVAEKCIGYNSDGTALALNSCGGAGGGAAFTTSAGLAGILTDETGTGAAVFADSPTFSTKTTLGTCAAHTGSGSPEGVVTAPICSTYFRTNGGASTTFYVKESGVSNTGWVAYGTPSGSGAPTTAGYLTKTADGGLSDEFALGTLATGLLRNTTTTGVPTIATACTHYLDTTCVLTNANLPTTVTGRTLDNTNTITGWDTLFTLQDNADNTKQGRFELSGLTTALTRVWSMPNATTKIMSGSDFAGTANGGLERTGTDAYVVIKHNRSATANPTATDDSVAGYAIGSEWINTTASPRTVWKASDVTSSAAVWVQSGVAATPTMQQVFTAGSSIATASSFATGLHIGLSATTGWRLYEDISLGPIFTCVVAGVENDCDYKRKIAAGKTFELQKSDGTAGFNFAGTGGALTNVTLNVESTGNAITTVQYASINAAACNNVTASPGMNLPTANAPTPTCFGTTTTQGTLSFADGSTQTASRNFRLRGDWTGAVDVDLVWFANAASANAVRWSVATGCTADAEATNTGPAAYNASSASNTAYTGTANQRKTTSFTGVATTNCAAGESMTLQIQRIGADGGDTLAAAAELLEVGLKTRAAQ